jgi:WD40 repeat protein
LQTKSRLYTLNGHKYEVSSLELVNATVLATGSADNTVKLWKIIGKELKGTIIRTLSGHADSVTSLDMYDANTLMSGSHDQTFRFWNWNTGACVKTIDTGLYINTFVVF